MNALEEIHSCLKDILPVATGIFPAPAPDAYAVLVPLSDTFDLHADNSPGVDVQEVRISLFAKGNYLAFRNRIQRALLDRDFVISGRLYNGYEQDTGYHHYVMDAAKHYKFKEE